MCAPEYCDNAENAQKQYGDKDYILPSNRYNAPTSTGVQSKWFKGCGYDVCPAFKSKNLRKNSAA